MRIYVRVHTCIYVGVNYIRTYISSSIYLVFMTMKAPRAALKFIIRKFLMFSKIEPSGVIFVSGPALLLYTYNVYALYEIYLCRCLFVLIKCECLRKLRYPLAHRPRALAVLPLSLPASFGQSLVGWSGPCDTTMNSVGGNRCVHPHRKVPGHDPARVGFRRLRG